MKSNLAKGASAYAPEALDVMAIRSSNDASVGHSRTCVDYQAPFARVIVSFKRKADSRNLFSRRETGCDLCDCWFACNICVDRSLPIVSEEGCSLAYLQNRLEFLTKFLTLST